MSDRHPLLQITTCYSDQLVDLVSEGYDCAIRVGYLQDSNLIAKRVGPIFGALVASPEYVRRHGAPATPDALAAHEALMRDTEAWQFLDGDKVVSIRPQGRFKADNAVALVTAAVAGIGIAWVPNLLTDQHVEAGQLLRLMARYPPPPAGIYVVRPPNSNPTRKIRVLTECFAIPPHGFSAALG